MAAVDRYLWFFENPKALCLSSFLFHSPLCQKKNSFPYDFKITSESFLVKKIQTYRSSNALNSIVRTNNSGLPDYLFHALFEIIPAFDQLLRRVNELFEYILVYIRSHN